MRFRRCAYVRASDELAVAPGASRLEAEELLAWPQGPEGGKWVRFEGSAFTDYVSGPASDENPRTESFFTRNRRSAHRRAARILTSTISP